MPRVSSREASIYYEVHGEVHGGRWPIAFAHGAGGNTLIWWRQVPYFSARYRVVTFDHRCFGRSLCPPEAFRPELFCEDLIAVLDAERIERVALVCQSMGGWTGLRMALEHPDRLSCLVLCGTPGGIVTDRILEAIDQIAIGASETGIRGNAALSEAFQRREPELAFLYDQIAGLNTGFSPQLLGRLATMPVQPEALRAHETPTLVISGEEDPLFPTEAIREVAGLIPGAELETIPGSGHSPYYEMPDRFNRLVDGFLSKQAG
ncbi:MAG TPA: alpha/beta fold hydrolase [Deltaproteobacteria bacterium]|nr:alpha/beta fold hydrolase [Deltaproteobacteria bacterium]